MQTINHKVGYKNIHPLLDEIENLYIDLSDDKVEPTLIDNSYDVSLQCIFENFVEYGLWSGKVPEFIDESIQKLKLPKYDSKNIIVCYSGGKDSLVTVLHYKNMGYNVYAYHIKGLNKTYGDEWKVAQQAADRFDFNLIFDEIKYSGSHMWVEHPMKNMLMANMALSYGISNNLTAKVAVGTFYSSQIVSDDFHICGGDSIDMWKAYDKVVQRFIPKFHIYIPNKNFHTAYRHILKNPDVLAYTISCMTPIRFRQLFRDRTIKNYSAKLLPNRCGCCWKCATEYLYFCDKGVLEYNEEYYLHCVEILANTIEQECGYRVYNLDNIWEKYMFYPIKKSKAREKLENAIVLSTRIKFAE